MKFKFTDSLDPSHFHCIRYLGPPIPQGPIDKNPSTFYSFKNNKLQMIAMMTFTWTAVESEPVLILPFWMKNLLDCDDDECNLNYEKILLEQVEEFNGALQLEWYGNLTPPASLPLEYILPELFGSKRPLCNGTVLSFMFQGCRYLLRVRGEGIEDGKVFWFDLLNGSLEFLNNQDNVVEFKPLKMLLEGSWSDEFKVLKHHLNSSNNNENAHDLLLVCGIPVPFQQNLVNALEIDFELVDISLLIPEEHLQVAELEGGEDTEDVLGPCKKVVLEAEQISNDLMQQVLKTIQSSSKRSISIFLSASRSIDSSPQLLQLEKSAQRFNFQVTCCTFPPVNERERLDILLEECGKDGIALDDLKPFKWTVNSLSLTDLMRIGRIYRTIDVTESTQTRLKKALESVKETTNNNNSQTYSILPHTLKPYPFTGDQKVKEEFMKYLKGPLMNPEAYERFGLPKSSGFLLHGPPGGGKTSLCLNVFTSSPCCDIFTIFHVPSASQLLSKYFGETEANIRKLFAQARERKPAIIFIDQIECLGRKRGLSGSGEDSGSTDRYLSTLLNEMDGIEGNEGVSVVACATDIELLDEALLRPGRLDRHFYLHAS